MLIVPNMSKMVYVSHFKHCTHALGKKPFEAAAAATADTLGGGGITVHIPLSDQVGV